MNILLLAPQPFFQVRGTPIATRQVIEVLAGLGHHVHVLTLPEGDDVQIPGLTIQRLPAVPGVQQVPPGFSWKKVVYDVLMLITSWRLCWSGKFHLVHAIEEACFIGCVLRAIYGIPYIYDMDSSLPDQLVERFGWLSPFVGPFRCAERFAIRRSLGVVAVCQALEDRVVAASNSTPVVRIEDVSLLSNHEAPQTTDFRHHFPVGPIIMYVGNLESYQGIGLLLDAFSLLAETRMDPQLVLVGGSDHAVARYRRHAQVMGLEGRVHFLGTQPVERLPVFLKAADVLVSPRVRGLNTPMKIFSYMDTGKPLVATRLPTHTQVLDEQIACLVEPDAHSLAEGISRVLDEPTWAERMAQQAKRRVEQRFRREMMDDKLSTFYESVTDSLACADSHVAARKSTSVA